MITCQHVGKSIQQRDVLLGVTFHIKKGEIVALLGPNGAGKSTMIQLLVGIKKPTEGTISICNQAPGSSSVQQKTGVMLQDVRLLDMVTVRELVKVVSGYYKNPMPMEDILKMTGLDPSILSIRTEKLSGGQKRQVNFALAVAGNPELLVLDEPTVGMDAPTRKRFWNTIVQLAKRGTTVIFTTHYLEEVESSATRVLVLEKGKIIQDATPNQLKQKHKLQRVSFQTGIPIDEGTLCELSIIDMQIDGTDYTFFTEDADLLLKELITFDVEMIELTISRGTLEDAYTTLTKRQEVS